MRQARPCSELSSFSTTPESQLAAAAARSASVSLLRVGGKSGARLPTNGTFVKGSVLTGLLCCERADLCSQGMGGILVTRH